MKDLKVVLVVWVLTVLASLTASLAYLYVATKVVKAAWGAS